MKRYRAPIQDGYRRKTLSIPEDLARRIDAHLAGRPGLTWSAYVSDELERLHPREPKRS